MMSESTQTEKVTQPIPSLKIDGVTVHQPIAKVEEMLQRFRVEQAEILDKIKSAEPEDEELLQEYGQELTKVQNNITRWGVPLHIYAPYKYPPSIFAC